ncbi:CubicO group peptidase (beta-lactamase class C family) [Saccharopolyspora lacisalsi]|uniref:CubicO group peptidase (Beta-lactamase class C family) n=1 Tax=Halosaccharopolyspora lacisalsi TaxID=1000566 RepID=A0A839E7W3_9PSEU|nr:serine hydrolase [Halosaccharopolyspora lacisalsi]MBA8827361.1 CubicO group peptidase (beta-lactamase class C family) [Halosaccharopolyspora lacisalsi]
MRTRMLVTALLSVAVVTTSGMSTPPRGEVHGRFDRPRSGFAPATTALHEGSPRSAGLDPDPIRAATRQLAAWTRQVPGREHPMYGGAVSLLAHDGTIVSREAAGYELRYADGEGTELPPGRREKARTDTIFDLASMTKLFTSIAASQQIEDGAIELRAPVAEYLPEFGVHGKRDITVRQLLTHTSGLQAEVQLWKLPPERRIPHVMELKPTSPPGSGYRYSDPNMIVLGELVERVSGKPLDEVVSERITEPLGMDDTGYNPPRSELHRIAATEYQTSPYRGMVRGRVHDENAWSLGGVAGHAGIFSTVDDLAVLGQALLNGGSYRGERILDERGVRRLMTNYNTEFPEHSHGLGFELDQRWYMAGLSGPRSAGHTGYTGTSIVLDPASRSMAILLTNRVHPSREWGSNNPSRVALSQGLAQSLAVEPRRGDTAWFTGSSSTPATLSTDSLGGTTGEVDVSFDAFVDTQRDTDGSDRLAVEYSTDDGRSWHPVTLEATGPGAPEEPRRTLAGSGHRAWWKVHGSIPADRSAVRVRWRYSPDERYVGRGVYVEDITVTDRDGVLLAGERQPGRLRADGWLPRVR